MRLKHLVVSVAIAGVAGGSMAPTDALAQGGTFVPIFSATYWDGLSMILRYIGDKEGGLDKLKGKTIGFIFFDGGYGREPLPLLHQIRE
jgi:branched-chain amino acid transport system substrate-binding protein